MKVREELQRITWPVQRTAVLDEVEMPNGKIRFRVRVSDEGRLPFTSRWFNDPGPASDFIDHMIDGSPSQGGKTSGM